MASQDAWPTGLVGIKPADPDGFPWRGKSYHTSLENSLLELFEYIIGQADLLSTFIIEQLTSQVGYQAKWRN